MRRRKPTGLALIIAWTMYFLFVVILLFSPVALFKQSAPNYVPSKGVTR